MKTITVGVSINTIEASATLKFLGRYTTNMIILNLSLRTTIYTYGRCIFNFPRIFVSFIIIFLIQISVTFNLGVFYLSTSFWQ